MPILFALRLIRCSRLRALGAPYAYYAKKFGSEYYSVFIGERTRYICIDFELFKDYFSVKLHFL